MRDLASLLLLTIVAVGCVKDPSLPLHTDFRTGMSQADIRSQFGEPVQVTTFRKKDEAIWGEIENYWATLPIGSTVVVWSYESENQMGAGRTELYFLDGSVEASGMGFSPKGVVYESNGT
jgi:hypothetical protein